MKLRLIKTTLVCCAAWLALGAAAAPASDASIEELLQVTRVESQLERVNANVEQWLRSAMTEEAAAEKLTPAQQRVFEQFPAKAAALIRQELDWSKMKPQYIQIYRDVYTQEEVDGQLAFYRSPVGQAVLEKMPQVMQKQMEMSQRQMHTIIPKLQTAIKEALAEAKTAEK